MAEDRDWEIFKQKLKAKTEIDLDLYKEPQMKRRINNLITRAGHKSCTEYFDHVCGDKDEFAAFIEYLTINVSEFFRTPEKFSKLETDVIPDLLKRSPKLNIWNEAPHPCIRSRHRNSRKGKAGRLHSGRDQEHGAGASPQVFQRGRGALCRKAGDQEHDRIQAAQSPAG